MYHREDYREDYREDHREEEILEYDKVIL